MHRGVTHVKTKHRTEAKKRPPRSVTPMYVLRPRTQVRNDYSYQWWCAYRLWIYLMSITGAWYHILYEYLVPSTKQEANL